MDRSVTLRSFLVSDLTPENIEHDIASQMRALSEKQRGAILTTLKPHIDDVLKKIVAFQQNRALLDEKTQDSEIDSIHHSVEGLKGKIRNVFDSPRYEFTHPNSIHSYRDFVENKHGTPRWLPRKEEIARLLRIAFQASQERIQKGEKPQDEAIEILDVGGGNGFLAKLLSDLAQANGVRIKITIIDPDEKLMKEASEAYQDEKNMEFRATTSDLWAKALYHHDTTMSQLLHARDLKFQEIRRVMKDFESLERRAMRDQSKLTYDECKKYLKIFEGPDFNIFISPEALKNRKTIYWDDIEAIVLENICDRMRRELRIFNESIEHELLKRPTRYDLVINSWMPYGEDFTSNVREANGAVIVYALHTFGASGIQPCLEYGHDDLQWNEPSYSPGDLYQFDAAWVGPSTRELQERWNEIETESFSNAFMVQTRRGFPEHLDLKSEFGIQMGASYPWEGRLTLTKEGLEPVHFPDNVPYSKFLQSLADQAQKQWKRTLNMPLD